MATDRSLHGLIQDQIELTPDLPAVAFEGRTLTYRELGRRAGALASVLRAHGVARDVAVGLFVERSIDMIVGLAAILEAGGAYLPIDPASPPDRTAMMLADAGVSVLLTQTSLAERAPATLDHVLLDVFDWNLRRYPAPAGRRPRPEDLAYVIYTSGSTGRPKGVGIEHRHIVEYTRAVTERFRLEPGFQYATVSTIAADLGHTVVFPSLTTGGCLHVISQAHLENPDQLGEYFAAHEIDVLKIVPSHLAALQAGRHPERLMPRRRLILGGESSRVEWVARLSALAPSCEIFNHYGPTETTVGVLTYHVNGSVPSTASGTLPLGAPLPHCVPYIVDGQGALVPPGDIGELWIGGESVARGYVNRPDLTAERFQADPFVTDPERRLYRSGDLARRLPDGMLEFCGRVDDQLKINGYRVEPGEIEAAVRDHAGVRDVHVLARDDGFGARQLVAYVVPLDAGTVSVSAPALRAHLRARLPVYMIPSAFVMLDRLPLNPNGKVDRRALPPAAAEPERADSSPDASGPRTATEIALAEIWRAVLNVERIRPGDSFFDLGGHSLLAFRAMARVRDVFDIEVPLRVLFEGQTLAGVAAMLDGFIVGTPGGRAARSAGVQEITL